MTNLCFIIAFILICIGIFSLLKLTPASIGQDISALLTKETSLQQNVKMRQRKLKKSKLKTALLTLKDALSLSGKGKMFAIVCMASIILAIVGIIIGVAINNIFLSPVLCVLCGSIPFFYANSVIDNYKERIVMQLETALSIITTSYIRNDDIIKAVRENLGYIPSPLNVFFKSFVGECTAIRSDTKKAIFNLSYKVDNEIFKEWCDTLVSCQDDRSLKVTLLPIVSKMTDVRIVNGELKVMVTAPRTQYYAMVGLALGSIPLLYLLNKDWFDVLCTTDIGKAIIAILFTLIFVTFIFLLKFSKPIQYRL